MVGVSDWRCVRNRPVLDGGLGIDDSVLAAGACKPSPGYVAKSRCM